MLSILLGVSSAPVGLKNRQLFGQWHHERFSGPLLVALGEA